MNYARHGALLLLVSLIFFSVFFAVPGRSQQSTFKQETMTETQIDELLRQTPVDSESLRAKLDKFIGEASLKRKRAMLNGKIMISADDPPAPRKKFRIEPRTITPLTICPKGTSGPGCGSCRPKPPICHTHIARCTRKSDSDPPVCVEIHSDCIEGTGTTC